MLSRYFYDRMVGKQVGAEGKVSTWNWTSLNNWIRNSKGGEHYVRLFNESTPTPEGVTAQLSRFDVVCVSEAMDQVIDRLQSGLT